jgi:hypothetical protein
MVSPWYINFVVSCALQILLFWRALRAGLWALYPFFYTYLAYTTLRSVAFAFPVVTSHPAYAKVYWWSYLVAAILRFGIAVEIHRYVFPRHSPLRSRAGVVVLLALTLLAFGFWIAGPGPGPSVFPDAMRKITVPVAAWILVDLGLAHYYGIRIGRNVFGMAVGILAFTGSELIYLAAMDLVPSLWGVWRYVHPIAFVFTLIVWTSALWRYHPNPHVPSLDETLAQEFLKAWSDQLAQIFNVLRRVMKP